MARLVYTSDLHGDLELYRAAGEAARARQADAVVFGGDLCPGTPSASSTRLPQAQPEFLLRELGPVVEKWKRAQPSLRAFAIPGNDDCQTILPALDELEEKGIIENLHKKTAKLGKYTLVGLAFVPPTPFSIKDFERRDSIGVAQQEPQLSRCVLSTPEGFKLLDGFEDYLDACATIEQELGSLPESDPHQTIAVIHCPPYRTRCDVLFSGHHIGSRAVRAWIERRQPLLTLHGHIHESPRMSGAFSDRIGRTWVINPGCDGRRPHLVFIELERFDELEHSIYGGAKK